MAYAKYLAVFAEQLLHLPAASHHFYLYLMQAFHTSWNETLFLKYLHSNSNVSPRSHKNLFISVFYTHKHLIMRPTEFKRYIVIYHFQLSNSRLDNFKSLLESSNSQLDNFIFPVFICHIKLPHPCHIAS